MNTLRDLQARLTW